MSDHCPDNVRSIGACFETPRPMTEEELAGLEMQTLKFGQKTRADLDGDGLSESFTISENIVRDHERLFSLSFVAGRSCGLGPSSIYAFPNFDVIKLSDEDGLRPQVAFSDVDGDGLLDLVLSRPNKSGEQSFLVYINANERLRKNVTEPSFYMVRTLGEDGDSWPDQDILNFDAYQNSPQICVHRPITSIAFHPGDARSVSVDGSPQTPIKPHQALEIDSNSFFFLAPISFNESFSIRFYDETGRLIKEYLVRHKVADETVRYNGRDGTEYILYNPRGRLKEAVFQEAIKKFEDNVHDKLLQIERLWGLRPVDKIVFLDLPFHNGTSQSGRVQNGTVFLTLDHFNRPPEEISDVVLHEAAHNLEDLLLGQMFFDGALLSRAFEGLKGKGSPVFAFLNESFFLKEPFGHSQDTPFELFASLTVDICAGRSALADALERWQGTHSTDENKRLRDDLQMLLQEYYDLMAMFGAPEEGRAMVNLLEPR